MGRNMKLFLFLVANAVPVKLFEVQSSGFDVRLPAGLSSPIRIELSSLL